MASVEPTDRSNGSSECSYHKDEDVSYVCVNCDWVLVCQKCVTEFHQGHSMADLDKVIPKKAKTIKKFIKKCEGTFIPKLDNDIQSIHDKLHENSTKIQKIVSDIKEHGESLKAQIDAVTKTMVTRCKDLHQENRSNMMTYKTEILTLHDITENKLQEYKQVLESGNKFLVYDFEQELPSPDNAEFPDAPILFLADFTPGITFPDQDLEHVFGAITIRDEMCREASFDQMPSEEKGIVTSDDLIVNFPFEKQQSTSRSTSYKESSPEEPESGGNEEPEPSEVGDILYEFQSPHAIDSISCKQFKNTCVLLEKGSKQVDFINEAGTVKHTVMSKAVIHDICISPVTARLWICTNDSVIEKAPANIPALKLRPGNDLCSICVTASDHIIVGSPLKVLIYNLEGKKRCKTKPGLIAYPVKLAACSKTNRLAVVDSDTTDFGGKDEPHVKVLSPALEMLFKFTGETILQRETTHNDNKITSCSIDPRDVCFDSVGNLLMAEAAGCSIHILNTSGKFIRTFYTDNLPPVAIHLQMNKKLWVGFGKNSKTVKVIKYQE